MTSLGSHAFENDENGFECFEIMLLNAKNLHSYEYISANQAIQHHILLLFVNTLNIVTVELLLS